MMSTKKLLLKLTDGVMIPGATKNIDLLLGDIFKYLNVKLNKLPLDSFGCALIDPKKGYPSILLDAHIDEVGFVTTSILENGFIKASACGGIDKRILPALEVKIHSNPPIDGIITSTPPHLLKDNPSNVIEKDIYIDTGLNTNNLKKTVCLGDRISFKNNSASLLGDRFASKSLDNRAGVLALLLACTDIVNLDLNLGVNVLFSNLEETSLGGAKTGGYSLFSDYALTIDTSFAHSRGLNKERCGVLGKGPLIGCAPILDKTLFEKLKKTAENEKIPYQIEVMSGKTSTNSDVLTTIRSGIKTALCSVPLRYMHTPVETVDLNDIVNTKKLITAFVKSLDKELRK